MRYSSGRRVHCLFACNNAGLTLVELLITVGLLLMAASLAATAIRWISGLLQLPNPSPAVAAINVVRELYNATSVETVNDCAVRITSADPVTGTLSSRTYSSAGMIACYRYTTNSVLQIYGHRVAGSCDADARADVDSMNATTRLRGLQRCEYEQQTAVRHLYP